MLAAASAARRRAPEGLGREMSGNEGQIGERSPSFRERCSTATGYWCTHLVYLVRLKGESNESIDQHGARGARGGQEDEEDEHLRVVGILLAVKVAEKRERVAHHREKDAGDGYKGAHV